jgi:tyrosyl-tRNA synthetase
MQGYDSVAMDVDVEMCGTDQIFNALAGRTLMQKLKGKEKLVIANNMIADEITGQLMSKSNNTGIFLDLTPNDLFGAVMSQSDGMIRPLAVGCTRLGLDKIEEMMNVENPRDAKIELAFEITKLFHDEQKAQEAKDFFINTFSKKEIPEDVAVYNSQEGIAILELLVSTDSASSKGDARRKIEQGGVSIDGNKITDTKYTLVVGDDGKVLKVGKKFFIKLEL